MANMLAGVWYDKQVSRMLKEEDPDTDLLIEMSKSAIQSFETLSRNIIRVKQRAMSLKLRIYWFLFTMK